MFTLVLDSPALGASRLGGHLDDAAYGVVGCCRLGRSLTEEVAVVARSRAGQALAEAAGVVPRRAGAHIADALAGTVVTCPAC